MEFKRINCPSQYNAWYFFDNSLLMIVTPTLIILFCFCYLCYTKLNSKMFFDILAWVHICMCLLLYIRYYLFLYSDVLSMLLFVGLRGHLSIRATPCNPMADIAFHVFITIWIFSNSVFGISFCSQFQRNLGRVSGFLLGLWYIYV